MKKNTAGQFVGVQMCSATDGSAFTGAVTVYVTGDAGVQAVGSVGAGACTHEGNGFHTYAPATAETNYDHVAFTFIGTGAIPATVQVYTSFPQTGDNFARLGAPAGASVSADVAAIKAETATILADTNDIQTRLPAALVSGRIDASVGAMAANVITAAATAADFTTEVTAGLSTLDAAGVRTAVGLASANLDTQLGAIDDYIDTEVAAIKVVTDKLATTLEAAGGSPGEFRFAADALVNVADVVWDELLSGHAIVGSTGAALSAAGGSGDPWATALPGAYGAGTAGKIIGDNINATISSRASQTSVDTLAGYVDTEVAAIKAKTDNLPADPADASDVAAAVAAVKLYADRTVVRGTVSATSPTTTTFTSSALSPAGVAADQFKGRIIVFDNDTTTTALRGQATDITASSAAANPLFTFTALTTAPQSGDTFSIL